MKKQLPKNWVEVSLKEVTKNRKGKKPNIQSEVEFEGSIPYMDIKALEHNKIRQYADVESSKLFEEGDIAMVWDGARSGWVSKTNFGAIGSTLVAFQPILFNSNYLFYYLLEKYPFINSNARGVGIPHVDPTVLWSLDFPLPPIAEQNRIVTKLDNLFSQLESIKTSMANIPLLLRDFRQQVLTQAFTGKLTKEWRKGRKLKSIYFYYDDIENDLEEYFNNKIQESKDNGSVRPRNQKNNKLSDKGDPELEKIPSEWKYYRAEKLCYLITDGVHFKPKYVEEGVRFLSVKNVRPFKINPNDCKYITEEEHKKYIQRCNPENGDILYTKVGATYGYAAKINLDFDFSIFVSLALIKPSKLINSSYLELLFNSPIILKQANYKVSGIGVPDLHLIEIRDFKIPLSSPDEQQEIVTRVESLFAKADAIEKQYESLKIKIDNLPQAILHKAFKGELTEQLDSDVDARELLKEIQALKATGGKVSKTGKSYKEKEATLDMVAEPRVKTKSKVVKIKPTNTEIYKRTLLAAEIVYQLKETNTLGHLKLQKMLYLCQEIGSMNLPMNFLKQAMGPYDNLLARSLDKQFVLKKWFEYQKDALLKYKPLENCGNHKEDFQKYFETEVEQINYLINKFKKFTSNQIEAVATLYACWKEAIEKKELITDKLIITKFYQWSKEKEKFREENLLKALDWMRRNGVEPKKQNIS